MAVRALLAGVAEVHVTNKNGSTPFDLAVRTTGRGGSGSPRAKEQQTDIAAAATPAGAARTSAIVMSRDIMEARMT